MNGYESVSIKKLTKRKLDNIGKKSDTYDSLINKLIDFYIREKKWKIGE